MAENPIICLRNRMDVLLERKRHLSIMLEECETELNECRNKYGALMKDKIEAEKSFAKSEGLI